MDRNILSVAMIYTNYDPKPHPPGGNIRPVIQATNYIKLHRPLRHPTLGHFQHHAFKRRKYVSPDYDFHPTTNHHLPMNKEKDVNARCFFVFCLKFFYVPFFWLRRNTKQKNRTEDTHAARMQISIPRADIVSLRFRETVMLR